MSERLFPDYHTEEKPILEGQFGIGKSKKTPNQNVTQPELTRKNIIYFGHESWNLMLNMMLGIRKAIKSHFYKYNPHTQFSGEDL